MSKPLYFVKPLSGLQVATKLRNALIEGLPAAPLHTITAHTSVTDSHLQISANNQPAADFFESNKQYGEFIDEVKKHKHIYIKNLTFSFRSWSMSYHQKPEDVVATIDVGETQHTGKDNAIALLDALHKQFNLKTRAAVIAESLPKEAQERLRSYDTAVNDLTANVSQLGTVLTEQSEKLGDFIRDKTEELEAKYQDREDELQQRHNKRSEELANQESEFKKRVSEFDDRERTVVRRDLLKKISEKIEEQKTAKLSETTAQKRQVIHIACGTSMLIGLGLVGVGVHGLYQSVESDWLKFIPFTTGVLLFASTLVFYLKWNNAWFTEHARAELANRKFAADILRASWIAELYFEWKEEKPVDFPPELIHSFTNGLFKDENWTNEGHHPAEQLVAGIAKFKKIKVGEGGLEIDNK